MKIGQCINCKKLVEISNEVENKIDKISDNHPEIGRLDMLNENIQCCENPRYFWILDNIEITNIDKWKFKSKAIKRWM